MTTSESFWDKIAPRYAKSPIKNMTAYDETMARTRSHLCASDVVTELGCGTGSTAILLAPNVAEMTATDISGNMIDIGRGKAQADGVENITFVKGDAAASGVAPTSQDAVLAFNLLHLVPDLPAALNEAHALLKPGGVFISKTVCLAEKGWHIRMIVSVMRLFRLAPYVNFLKISDLENMVETAGFKIVETGNYPASPPSRFIVARKI